MALTALESIAEKLAQKRQTDLNTILNTVGSAAITKNEYNITVVDDSNIASSLIFKNLSKPKYDEVELIKAIDVDVKELMPNIPTPNLDLVPRLLYTEQVGLVEDLRKQVQRLTLTIDDLNSQITTLKAQVQTEINNRLTIEQTNDVLTNQIDTLTNTINDFTGQISISLQKSVDESILRASLQSQNAGFKAQIEALIQQINSLNSIIEGLQAQLGAVRQQKEIEATTKGIGGTIINKIVNVSFAPSAPQKTDPPVYLRLKNSSGFDVQWKYGNKIKFINNDKVPVQISINPLWGPSKQNWFAVDWSGTNTTGKIKYIGQYATWGGEIPAESTQEVTLLYNTVNFDVNSHSVEYPGTMDITVTRANKEIESKTFKILLGIYHDKSF